MSLRIFVLLLCLTGCVTVSRARAADEETDDHVLSFNCISTPTYKGDCDKESTAQLKAMGCDLSDSVEKPVDCVRLTDETLCHMHTTNCLIAKSINKKWACGDGFALESALAPEKCTDCAEAHYAKGASVKALFAKSYYCKKK